MSKINTKISFKNNEMIVTSLSVEGGSLRVDVKSYDSLFFGSIGTLAHLSERQYAAFSQALKEMEKPEWNKDDYVKSLTSTNGKTRLADWSKANSIDLTEKDCADIHARKTEIFNENMKKDGVEVRAGVIELLEQAKANGVKTAFVTCTPKSVVEAMFDSLKGIKKESFDFWMSRDDQSKYGRDKPTADPYLFAMKQLGVKTPLTIEDSQISMGSPLAANLDCIVTPNNWCKGHNYDNALATVEESRMLLNCNADVSQEDSSKLLDILSNINIKSC